MSLSTCDPRRARFLAGQLTAHSDDIFQCAMADADSDIVMTCRQLDGVFRERLLAHLDKLHRIAAAERADPNFDPDDSRRCDHCMGDRFDARWLLDPIRDISRAEAETRY